MATRLPMSWLVITTALDRNGCETALNAHASYNEHADVPTVTAPGGQREDTHVGRHPMQPLAKLVLRGMFRREQEQGWRGS